MANKTHKVKQSDKARIRCQGCGATADICEHSAWKGGISFWYYCDSCYATQLASLRAA
jgi:flavoprotein